MKIRSGFVSNSSSSSFIVFANPTEAVRYTTIEPTYGTTLQLGHQIGNISFGWGPEKIHNTGSKINFAYLQVKYMYRITDEEYNNPNKWIGGYLRDEFQKFTNVTPRKFACECLEMLENCIKHNNPEILNIDTMEIFDSDSDCYIDHQSAANECKNIEIFKDEETLYNFLFNPKTYIQLDNDNN